MAVGMPSCTFGVVAVLSLQLLLGRAAGQAPAPAPAAGPVTLASLKPIKEVTLRFNISGQVAAQDSSCTTDVINSPCLQQVQAAQDTVLIRYGMSSTGTLPRGATNVTITACYSKYSQIDRPWRFSNAIIAKDKSCPFKVLPAPGKPAFSPLGGNATWKVPSTVPVGTYYIRVLVMCKSPAGPVPCGMGSTLPAYFQVNKINSTPASLVGGSIAACFLGPLSLAAYFVYEKMTRKTA